MANYEQLQYSGGAPDTTLAGDITAVSLTFSVAAGTGANYPDGSTGPFYVAVDYDTSSIEKIRCTSRAADTFTVPVSDGRGVDGTTAAIHKSGAKVRHVHTAHEAQEANRAAVNTVGKVTAKGDLLVGTGANTMARLPVGSNGQIPTADSTQTTGIKWAANPAAALDTVNHTTSTTTTGSTLGTATVGAPADHAHQIGAHDHSTTPKGGTLAQTAITKTVRIPHTWAIPGNVAVPSGDTNYVVPFFVPIPAGQTATLQAARYVIHGGTSATVKVQRNGVDITGYTAISVTTTAATTTQTQALTADDLLALVVTAVTGNPVNLTFTVYVDYAV